MATAHLQRQRLTVALLAAAILFVQSFFSAWALGAQPMRDAFGNELCITGSHDSGSSPSGEHGGGANCCEFGCGTMPMQLLPPDSADSAPAWPLFERVDEVRTETPILRHEPDHDPGSPRAPPRA